MKKLIAVVCLSAAILIPAATQAFTLYSPALGLIDELECTVVNVGNIMLQAQYFYIAAGGQRIPADPEWFDLPPNGFLGVGGGAYPRCAISVRAKNPRRTATKSMVRTAAKFTDNVGKTFAMEIK
jgi:hypothetical protein